MVSPKAMSEAERERKFLAGEFDSVFSCDQPEPHKPLLNKAMRIKKPIYLKLTKLAKQKKIKAAKKMLKKCSVCPRDCRVNRQEEELGFCGAGSKAEISSFHPHFGEEPPLVGKKGSGTIFFTHCNLKCLFCQNFDISQCGQGFKMEAKELADAMIALQNRGCHNINLVSPSIYVPQILEALPEALKQGLKIPLVYNTGGYDAISTLKILDGIIDIYMPDIKYADNKISLQYSLVPDYWQIVTKAVKEMQRQAGDLVINKEGIAERGLIIRHLVLPEKIAGTRKVCEFIAKEISPNAYVNIMDQYHPAYKAYSFPPLDRPVSAEEFEEALQIAKEAGLKRFA